MGMDFIGPLKATQTWILYILVVVCYMSRLIIPFACKAANVEDVIWCLKLLFAMYRKPHAFYLDPGQHFFNAGLAEFLKSEGIAVDFRPSGASKSTGTLEVCNRLLEAVLRKDSSHTGKYSQNFIGQ